MRSGVAVLARKSACYDSGGGTVHYVLYIRFYGFIEIFAYCFSFKKNIFIHKCGRGLWLYKSLSLSP